MEKTHKETKSDPVKKLEPRHASRCPHGQLNKHFLKNIEHFTNSFDGLPTYSLKVF